MKIELICVGTLKEKYWKAATDEYKKRLTAYGSLSVIEIKEAPSPEREGAYILSKVRERSFIIALDVRGKPMSSEIFASYMADLAVHGKSHITFIIGGSNGLSDDVLKHADLRLSFSEMTYPHQLMRVILLEQIYRSYKINNNETYHK